jgi:uncharacterized membrane protein YkoI
MIRPPILLPILAALMLTATAARADEDHERVRRAFEAGEIMPLSAILEQIDPAADGEILEVELEDDDGDVLVYEVKLLTPDGRIVKRLFDARSGKTSGAPRDED